jgi:hypothetical protein
MAWQVIMHNTQAFAPGHLPDFGAILACVSVTSGGCLILASPPLPPPICRPYLPLCTTKYGQYIFIYLFYFYFYFLFFSILGLISAI